MTQRDGSYQNNSQEPFEKHLVVFLFKYNKQDATLHNILYY